MAAVRAPAVAGTFYPGEAAALTRTVDELLAAAPAARPAPRAIIVPHAGYIYSGSTAARAYRQVAAQTRRVVLLGPSHRVPVDGMALPGVAAYATPLGEVPLDAELVARAEAQPGVLTDPVAHAYEHSLEVQLPFLQRVLGEFTLLPLSVGRARTADVAGVINALWDPETLVVISSDLSHYHRYAEARRRDERTLAQILAGGPDLDHYQACGATPVNGMLVAAAGRGLAPTLLGACNSGDTAGDHDRVVGYAAVAYYPDPDAPDPDRPDPEETP
ncbi:AmmeMemoRadiSam system protein B [Granulicoccus phenolivorans]|uniref:AmmeMemoRadiSam system protein B n=1 Tax=Granulicoccus phenolivorans TaxID=266854 RepID=UPI000688F5FA|nr:AmmeMemoRadiSam system protein B [Granulicoccus phenolivorans]